MVLIDSLNKTIPGGQKLARGGKQNFFAPPPTKILNTRLMYNLAMRDQIKS